MRGPYPLPQRTGLSVRPPYDRDVHPRDDDNARTHVRRPPVRRDHPRTAGSGAPDRGPDGRGGARDSRYDTTDRAAMERIGVRERTGDSTTYVRRPRPDDVPAAAAGDALDQVGDPPARRAGRRAAASTVRKGQGKHGPMFWRNRPRWLRRLVLLGLLSSVLMVAALVALVLAFTKVPLPATVNTAEQTSVITYADGRTEIAKIGTVNRTNVPLSQVSVDAQHAVLAAENKNFYSEPGISPKGIARAIWVNLSGGEIAQGGSTITQQYAKNAYLTQERTFSRKFKEIAMAIKIDQQYSKDDVLEFYLNTIYFGRGCYGIEAAAKTYFGKPAKDLTAEEGAVIGGLIRSPNALDPRATPAAAERRWHEVIDTMAAKGWLDAARAGPDKKPPVTKEWDKSNGLAVSSPQAAYIRDQVKAELIAAGITEQQINLQGLRIQTSIDQGRQTAAYLAVTNVLQKPSTAVPDLRTGLVAVEPSTGRVLAWYGGSIYGKGANGQTFWEDNVSEAKVPPGSTFKPITLATALTHGASLNSTYEAPDVLKIPGNSADGTGTYVVHNDEEHGNFGYPNLVKATAESINTVFVPLGITAGIDNVISTARALGVSKDVALTDDAGVTLGRDGISAKNMVAVYSTFANGGKATTPHLVDRVVDGKGKVIYEGPTGSTTALSASVTADVTYALQSVIKDGTGKAAQLADGRPVAGKTGTTDKFRTAWFCGYVPQVAACVNMFRGDGGVSKETALTGIPGAMSGVYGGGYPAKVWKAFMDGALTGVAPQPFVAPKYVGTVTNASPSPTPEPSVPPLPAPMPSVVLPIPTQSRPTPESSPTAGATTPPGPVQPTVTPKARPSPTSGTGNILPFQAGSVQ